jgi:hypothetical protein
MTCEQEKEVLKDKIFELEKKILIMEQFIKRYLPNYDNRENI